MADSTYTYTFTGWRQSSSGKLLAAGAEVKMISNDTFTAEYIAKKIIYTVTFNSGAGNFKD